MNCTLSSCKETKQEACLHMKDVLCSSSLLLLNCLFLVIINRQTEDKNGSPRFNHVIARSCSLSSSSCGTASDVLLSPVRAFQTHDKLLVCNKCHSLPAEQSACDNRTIHFKLWSRLHRRVSFLILMLRRVMFTNHLLRSSPLGLLLLTELFKTH